jgi:hypothetical protein
VGFDGVAPSLVYSVPASALASSLVLTYTLTFLMVFIPSNKNGLLLTMHSCSSNADSSFKASSLPCSFAMLSWNAANF